MEIDYWLSLVGVSCCWDFYLFRFDRIYETLVISFFRESNYSLVAD